MRVHLGSGSVYLREWVNVDLPLPHVYLAKERHDLVEAFITEENLYYARHANKTKDRLREGPVIRETVCDVYGSFSFMPVRPESVSEILSRQVFEHLSMDEGRKALKEAHRALKPGGILRLDIPDPEETLRLYGETRDEFYIRHLFGPRLSEFGFHTHYTRAMLQQLAEEASLRFVKEEENIHFYPAFCLQFAKV